MCSIQRQQWKMIFKFHWLAVSKSFISNTIFCILAGNIIYNQWDFITTLNILDIQLNQFLEVIALI